MTNTGQTTNPPIGSGSSGRGSLMRDELRGKFDEQFNKIITGNTVSPDQLKNLQTNLNHVCDDLAKQIQR